MRAGSSFKVFSSQKGVQDHEFCLFLIRTWNQTRLFNESWYLDWLSANHIAVLCSLKHQGEVCHIHVYLWYKSSSRHFVFGYKSYWDSEPVEKNSFKSVNKSLTHQRSPQQPMMSWLFKAFAINSSLSWRFVSEKIRNRVEIYSMFGSRVQQRLVGKAKSGSANWTWTSDQLTHFPGVYLQFIYKINQSEVVGCALQTNVCLFTALWKRSVSEVRASLICWAQWWVNSL